MQWIHPEHIHLADMIITHHPMIFSGIKKINNHSFTSLFEAAQMEGGDANIAAAFHEEYQRLYHDFLLELFDAQYAE